MVKLSAPGDKAEEKFCAKLQPMVGKTLTDNEKKILIFTMKKFNEMNKNYFSESDIERIKNSTISITEIIKVGSKKSSNIKTKKNDIKIITDFKLNNNKYFFFGISYKYRQARTIQSWSNINTWETIFNKEHTPKHYIENLLKILTKITENQARNSDYYFLGSTIHLKPLDKHYKEYFNDMEEYENEILKMKNKWSARYPTEHTKYIDRISNRIRDDKKLKYQLNKYFNKILRNEPHMFHYILFGEEEEQCLFYYRENTNISFSTLQDLFDQIGEQLFISGPPNNQYAALIKLRDKIEVVPNYVYPSISASNNSVQYLVIWNNERGSSNRKFYTSQELFVNGNFIPYYEFRRKRPSPPEMLNFTKLKKYYNDEFSIKFGNVRMNSKNFPNLPNDISTIFSSTNFSVREKVEFSIQQFMLLFNMDLFNIMTESEWNSYINDISRMYKDYKEEGQLKFLIKLFRVCLQILKERNDNNLENNTTYRNRFKSKVHHPILDINYSTIFQTSPEKINRKRVRNYQQDTIEELVIKKKK